MSAASKLHRPPSATKAIQASPAPAAAVPTMRPRTLWPSALGGLTPGGQAFSAASSECRRPAPMRPRTLWPSALGAFDLVNDAANDGHPSDFVDEPH